MNLSMGLQLPTNSSLKAPLTTTSKSGETVHEYSIRVPKNGRKKFHLMRLNNMPNVDFAAWKAVKMERENNARELKAAEEDQPKFGAGSEFGRDAREEARRKKLGMIARKYKPDDQPWLMRVNGKGGKKYKGIREGGFSENAAYYVFVHAPDGTIEAFPLQEWYNFSSIQTFKHLSAEEAEEEFGRRNKVLNYFTLMMRKRLKGDEEESAEGELAESETKKKGTKKDKELKISEMDDWMDSSSSSDSDDEEGAKKKKEEDEDDGAAAKKKAKNAKNQKKKKVNDEAFEDSDDGDEEGRELDYITSSSESEVEVEKQLQGVDEEKGLRKLLTSDEDSENEDEKKDEEEDEEKDDEKEKGKKEDGEGKKKKKLKKKDAGKKKKDAKAKESSSDFSPDSDSDETKKSKEVKKDEDNAVDSKPQTVETSNRSRSGTPISDLKRKYNISLDSNQSKKMKVDMPGLSSSLSNDSGITEDAVRRYLMRKPMTTTELLQKFKTKKTGLTSEQLVNIMTQILKRINPVKQTIKGKMYLSIKS